MATGQGVATIMLPDETHIVIKNGYSEMVKGKGIRKVFETETSFIYASGKPVENLEDLEWLPEPARTKALNWYKTGKKGDEVEELTEVQKLMKRIAELEGQAMGKKEVETKVKEKVAKERKKIQEFHCHDCGKGGFKSGLAVSRHKPECPKRKVAPVGAERAVAA